VIPDIGDKTVDAAGEGTVEYVMPLMTKELDKGVGRGTVSDIATLAAGVVLPNGTKFIHLTGTEGMLYRF
jgi:hypothetical protein